MIVNSELLNEQPYSLAEVVGWCSI